MCGWKAEITNSKLMWALGTGRVQDPRQLKSQTPLGSPYQTLIYTDFTMIQGRMSMELLSDFVDSKADGACVSMVYKVASISLADNDLFELSKIDITGL